MGMAPLYYFLSSLLVIISSAGLSMARETWEVTLFFTLGVAGLLSFFVVHLVTVWRMMRL